MKNFDVIKSSFLSKLLVMPPIGHNLFYGDLSNYTSRHVAVFIFAHTQWQGYVSCSKLVLFLKGETYLSQLITIDSLGLFKVIL